MGIIPRDIIGLYLERDRVQYCTVRRTVTGLSLRQPGRELAAQGTIEGVDYSCLRKFLEGLLPNAKFEMVVALSRETFFVRDMRLPPMDLEEAWWSVQNNLAVYCHLPPEDIYHDVLLSQSEAGHINALVFYALRKEIDKILDIFDQTGKRHLLKRVIPFSLGVYVWLQMQGYSMPLKLILPPQGETYELGIYSKEGFLYSAAWPLAEGGSVSPLVLEGLAAKFGQLDGQPYFLGPQGSPILPGPDSDKLGPLPSISENAGVAAIAGALWRKRQISLDGRPTKIRRFRVWYLVLPLCIVLGFMLGYWTWQSYKEVSFASARVKAARSEVKRLNDRIKPLEEELQRLKKSRNLFKDVETYVKGKPDLYKAINEIAALVPEGTWFSYLTYDRGKITLRGTSEDALEVLKSLRKSEMFKEVKLVGSVSRNRFDNERFRIVMELSSEVKSPKSK